MSEERVSRSAAFALLAQMVGSALTAVLTVYLGRALAPRDYGSLTFALGVIVIATVFADLGITSSTGRYMAERRDAPAAAAAVFRIGMRLKLRVALVASVVLFALAAPICEAFGTSGATWPLRALAISLLAQSTFLLLLAAFIAIGRVRYNLVLATVESIVEVLASVVLVVLGAGATGAACGNAAGYAVGAVFGLIIAARTIGALRLRPELPGPVPTWRHPEVSSRDILSYARPLLAIDAAFRAFASIDVLLIAALVGGGAPLAAFGLAIRLGTFLDYPAGALASAVAPRLARWRERRGELELLGQSMRYLLILQTLFTAPIVVWSPAIMHLIFADKYPEAPAVLQTLAPFVYLSGISQIATLAVNYLGEARRRVPIALAMLTLNGVIDAILLPRIGVVAGAIGTSAAYALWVPAHIWILHARAGLKLAPLLVTVLRTCVAGAAMAGSLAALGTGVVSPQLMAVGVVVGPLTYLLALFAVRELTTRDLAFARTVVARRIAG
jgi:O-antigen/teichoic acid export membrane protein